MRFLRQNTATIVTVGPFYDKTDGITPENALTITNEHISFVVDANDGGAPALVLDNVAGSTSGTANDLNYIANCDAGLMQIELSAANTNYVGRAFITITDATNHCPVFHEFMILPATTFDALVLGTESLATDANIIKVLGTACTAATAGVLDVNANITKIGGITAPATSGVLDVNLAKILGTACTAATAGTLDTNVKRVANVLVSGTGTTLDPWGPP